MTIILRRQHILDTRFGSAFCVSCDVERSCTFMSGNNHHEWYPCVSRRESSRSIAKQPKHEHDLRPSMEWLPRQHAGRLKIRELVDMCPDPTCASVSFPYKHPIAAADSTMSQKRNASSSLEYVGELLGYYSYADLILDIQPPKQRVAFVFRRNASRVDTLHSLASQSKAFAKAVRACQSLFILS